ncbi:putative substrate-binding periplasmic (PBP) ABC transporter protein [Hydrogenophaga taeniospiralis CCUG 15921]|uniref:Substrate-binding periplasmic (PBP) ABC transporter protein n=1 Tax=Hydrogenophaga taeniospiralis CCUG 15921 TaxID=1281780 RepID=A0A9X4NSY7_9BURK|nr:amino acid ABC transporter substrate-binding protein [Hydrogenophaga taeniospiralis]MDG5976079.1 putative substrate-binding periplasmic (PBP) ABC transporter protein [Hydrogenophaga taeniospiralis CCUG 15921]
MNLGLFFSRRATQTAAVACALVLAPAVHADLLDEIKARKHMVLAHRDASIPFSYVDGQGRVMGYSIDICHRLVEAVRVHLALPALDVKYLPVTSSTRITAIAQRQADLECGSTTNNAERRKQVDYTVAHFVSSSRLVVRKRSGVTALTDLAGQKVVSTKGSTNLKTLKRLNAEQALRLDILEAEGHAEGFTMVADGRAAAFAMDDVLLYGLIATAERPDDYAVVGKVMSIEPYAIMLPKNEPAFKRLINEAMRRIILDREIYPIYQRWFESPIPPRGTNLKLPMPFFLRDSFKYPSDRVDDWYKD